MMECKKCGKEIPEQAQYCPWCGTNQASKQHSPKRRANGQGSVYKVGKTWTCAKVFGYIASDDGKLVANKATKGGFKTKKEAYDYIPKLEPKTRVKSSRQLSDRITTKALFDIWLPTHLARGKSKSLKVVYTAAIGHFQEFWQVPFAEVQIDDWQACIDDNPRGRQTKENMRTVLGLMYKYAIPRGAVPHNLNLAQYLHVSGEAGRRYPFTDLEIETIRQSIGKVRYADYIYCLIYLGYRPSEFLSREFVHYIPEERAFFGGVKTDKGKNRYVTISPKIQPYIDAIMADRKEGYIFCDEKQQPISTIKFREYFASALHEMGIESTPDRKLTPYSCRHTFASLMDRVSNGGDNAKLELIGHTNTKMLRHYQHSDFNDLRKITDEL